MRRFRILYEMILLVTLIRILVGFFARTGGATEQTFTVIRYSQQHTHEIICNCNHMMLTSVAHRLNNFFTTSPSPSTTWLITNPIDNDANDTIVPFVRWGSDDIKRWRWYDSKNKINSKLLVLLFYARNSNNY